MVPVLTIILTGQEVLTHPGLLSTKLIGRESRQRARLDRPGTGAKYWMGCSFFGRFLRDPDVLTREQTAVLTVLLGTAMKVLGR